MRNCKVEFLEETQGKETNVFLQDGSDYRATMATKPDFGCVSWRSRT